MLSVRELYSNTPLSDIYELTPKAHAHKHKPTHTSIDTQRKPSDGERPTAQLPIAQLVPPLVRGFAKKDLLIDSSGMADLWALPIRTRGERGNGVGVGGSNDALKPRAATPPPPSPPRHILPHAFKSRFRDKQGGGGVCVCVCVCVCTRVLEVRTVAACLCLMYLDILV